MGRKRTGLISNAADPQTKLSKILISDVLKERT